MLSLNKKSQNDKLMRFYLVLVQQSHLGVSTQQPNKRQDDEKLSAT